jgi:hypothetical protein
MFMFGGWLLTLWVTIQVRRCVYLEYPYLKVGIVFLSLGAVALLCLLYAAKKRGGWGALYVVPLVAGLWTMVVVPDIVPYDTEGRHHVRKMADTLDSFSKREGHFPDRETALPAAVLREPSPYYQTGRQLPFRTVLVPNATGPVLDNPGADPGVIFYAVSADLRKVWLTGTELSFPHPIGDYVRFIRLLSGERDMRVLHLRAAQMPASQ